MLTRTLLKLSSTAVWIAICNGAAAYAQTPIEAVKFVDMSEVQFKAGKPVKSAVGMISIRCTEGAKLGYKSLTRPAPPVGAVPLPPIDLPNYAQIFVGKSEVHRIKGCGNFEPILKTMLPDFSISIGGTYSGADFQALDVRIDWAGNAVRDENRVIKLTQDGGDEVFSWGFGKVEGLFTTSDGERAVSVIRELGDASMNGTRGALRGECAKAIPNRTYAKKPGETDEAAIDRCTYEGSWNAKCRAVYRLSDLKLITLNMVRKDHPLVESSFCQQQFDEKSV